MTPVTRVLRYALPLALFIGLSGFLFRGLRLDPREIPSPFIGKPAPDFAAPLLSDPAQQIRRDDLLGKVWVLNVWASWCAPCRDEHPVLLDFARRRLVPVYGLNYKDQRDLGQRFLRSLGDPYAAVAFDADGRIGIDYGVYGVPETFVIDRAGIVRYKHVGPLTPQVIGERIEPLVKELEKPDA